MKIQTIALRLMPSIGIIIFLGLYVFATSQYPGGSVAYPDAQGFDWIHNYWCDLFTDLSINGLVNTAKPYGVAAMILLCALVAIFFFQFADAYGFSKRWRYAIKISGAISMLCGALIFTELHNTMIGVASIFAIIPVVGIFKGLIQTKSHLFLQLGVIVVILLLFCNVAYYTSFMVDWLPFIQKIALLATLAWIIAVNIYMRPNELVKS